MGVLQHDAQGAAQVVLADVAHVDAVVGDGAGLDIVKPVDEIGNGGFSRAGGADEGDLLAGLGVQGQVPQHRLFRHIGKVHMGKAYIAPQGHQGAVRHTPVVVVALLLQGHLALVLLGRQVQDAKNPLGTGQGHHQSVELLGDLADAVGKGADILQKADEDAAGPLPCQPQDAHRAGDGIEDVGQVVENGAHHGGDGGGGGGGLAQVLVDDVELLHDLLFVGEHLHVTLAGNHLLHIAADGGGKALLAGVGALADFGGDPHHQHHDGPQHHHDGKQPHGQGQHHGNGAHQGGDGDGQLGDAVLQQLVGGLDVAGVVAHQSAGLVFVEEPHRLALHGVEQLRAQLLHDDGTALQHQAVQQIVGQGRQQIQARQAQDQADVLGIRLVGSRTAGLQQVCQGLHAVGSPDGGGHIGQNRQHGRRQQQAAVLEVAHQTPQDGEGVLYLFIIFLQVNSRHDPPPPLSSGSRTRHGKYGCGTAAPDGCPCPPDAPGPAPRCGRRT